MKRFFTTPKPTSKRYKRGAIIVENGTIYLYPITPTTDTADFLDSFIIRHFLKFDTMSRINNVSDYLATSGIRAYYLDNIHFVTYKETRTHYHINFKHYSVTSNKKGGVICLI